MSRGFNSAPFPGMGFRKVGGMPKEKISDDHMSGWFTEVSWRRQECVCPCGEIWSADTPTGETCPGCQRIVSPTPGHVQLASVNPDSPFVFPANPHAPEAEPAEPFDGWRVTLDADQIDYLIAVLRKARRQAFPEHHSAHAGTQDREVTITFDGDTFAREAIAAVNRTVYQDIRRKAF